MPGLPIRQQCWNHETREAVCRCPGCSRSYCRECVTEHEARLLCAACLRKTLPDAAVTRRAARRVPRVVVLAAGLLLAWFLFLGLAAGVSEFSARMEQAAWQER
jgi:hypothetical protein